VKDWIRQATDGGETNIEARLPDTVLDGVRHDTTSSDDEIRVLISRLRRVERGPDSVSWALRLGLIGGGLLLAGAAAAAVSVVAPGWVGLSQEPEVLVPSMEGTGGAERARTLDASGIEASPAAVVAEPAPVLPESEPSVADPVEPEVAAVEVRGPAMDSPKAKPRSPVDAPPAERPAPSGTPAVASAVVAEAAVDPCQVDAFSSACAAARRPGARALSPEQHFEALTRAMQRVGQDPQRDLGLVEDANGFLNRHGQTGYADDVRVYRVQAAFAGDRASKVIEYADAFLVVAPDGHPRRRDVERWRRIATLRISAIDAAQKGDCRDALPLLRELVGLEIGVRQQEALAWRGLCAEQLDDADEAREALRQVKGEDLEPALHRSVQEAWTRLR